MEIENNSGGSSGGLTPLGRAKALSQALSEAARRARYSSRSNRNLSGGGFQSRRGETFIRWVMIISFCLIVAIPGAVTILYYAFVASDQFVSEARFTIGGGDVPSPDGIAAVTGIPAIAIIQDTQIVTNYIHSRAALEKLQNSINVRALYATEKADWVARFNAEKSIEKFLKYWEKMTEVSIKMPSGIVELKVRAFSAEESALIARSIVTISEELINDIKQRMHRDAVANAEKEVEATFSRLAKSRIALQQARNDEGILDATKAAEALNLLITTTRSSLLRLQQEYMSQQRVVSENAPQMRALKSRIETTAGQIRELESKLTDVSKKSNGGPNIAASMTKFAQLELEKQIAERLYASAITSLEVSRLVAESKLMYINTFVRPVAPQEAQYPKRVLYTFLLILGFVSLWGACCGLMLTVRNHMA